MQALIRRTSVADTPINLVLEDLSMNLLTRDVVRAGKKIDLQPREFALLEYLMRNTGRVVSKTMIMEHVWDYDFDPQTNVVDVSDIQATKQDGQGFRAKNDPHHPGSGVCP